MSDRLMTTEVKVESPNWNVEGNTKGLIKVMNTWFNYYKQIENNLVVGAKAIFLVCRDLYDAQQNLPPKEFELLKQKIHLSEATISKYIIVKSYQYHNIHMQIIQMPKNKNRIFQNITNKIYQYQKKKP